MEYAPFIDDLHTLIYIDLPIEMGFIQNSRGSFALGILCLTKFQAAFRISYRLKSPCSQDCLETLEARLLAGAVSLKNTPIYGPKI
jgi:hypothetical protein